MEKELITDMNVHVYHFDGRQITNEFGDPLTLKNVVERNEDSGTSKYYRSVKPVTDEEFGKKFVCGPFKMLMENKGIKDFLREPQNREFVSKYIKPRYGLYTMDSNYYEPCFDLEKHMYFRNDCTVLVAPNLLHVMSYRTNCKTMIEKAVEKARKHGYDLSRVAIPESLCYTFETFETDRLMKLKLLEYCQKKMMT